MTKTTIKHFISGFFMLTCLLLSLNTKAQPVCNCQEYLYLNEPSNDATHKFEVAADGTLTEINPTGPWYPNGGISELNSPHGLVPDLNGYLYVGEDLTSGSDIRRITCDGTLMPESEFVINDQPSFNLVSVGNTLLANSFNNHLVDSDLIFAYDLCTGDNLGSICVAEPDGTPSSEGTGLIEDPDVEGCFYAYHDTYIWKLTLADLNNTGNCILPTCELPEGIGGGIAIHDEFAYVVDGSFSIPGNLKKWDLTTCTLDAESIIDTDPADDGPYHPFSIAYSPTCDCIYASHVNTGGGDGISQFDLDLNYQGEAAGGITTGKFFSILKECCPSPLTQTIDQTYCEAVAGEKLFLNKIFPCDGIICGAEWTADSGNNGMTYDACDQSITLTAAEACGTFTKQGSNAQCGTFDLIYNVEILVQDEVTVVGSGNICPDNPSIDLTASNTATGASFQWQISTDGCVGTWSDIDGATETTYTVTGITAETYYRAVTTLSGNCSTGSCEGMSDCVTVGYSDVCEEVSVCNCTEYIYLNEPTTDGAIHKFQVNADGSLAEIGSPWFDNAVAGDNVTAPHGLGVDLNGFLYIGETRLGDIRKFTCDGDIFPATGTADSFVIDDGGYNITSYGNTMFVNSAATLEGTNGITAYDLCTGLPIGYYCLDGIQTQNPGRDWGMYVDKESGILYANSSFNLANESNYLYKIDLNNTPLSPLTDATNCISPFIQSDPNTSAAVGLNVLPESSIYGITTDTLGNIYMVEKINPNDNAGSLNVEDARLLKYDATGVLVAISDWDTDPLDGGYHGAIGIVYSETANLLYVSTISPTDDCISVFDTNLNYTGINIPSPGTGDNGKGIAINTECCPSPLTQTIDQTYCEAVVGDKLFLNELFPCDGIVCGAPWEVDPSTTGMTYDECDQSITITDAEACGTFTKQGSNAQCGAFDLTYNLEILTPVSIEVSADQTVCEGTAPTELSVTTTATDIQWQMSTSSCTEGFENIDGATSATYQPAAPTAANYYRAIVNVAGNCSTGSCPTESACISLSIDPDCVAPCSLTPSATPQACQDSGTSSDASDDVFDVTVDASAVNGGTQFSVSDGTNTFGPFDYGTGGTVTGLAADGNTITLTFTDAGDETCTGSADVSQNPCSSACTLSPTATPQACQDSGTSGDASDDVFDVTVDASAVNGGTQFSVSDGTNTYGPFDYGTGGTVTGLTADGNTITLTFTDAGDATCTGSADVSQNSCSSACSLSPTATPQACQDSGTSSDASDDVFDVTVDASAVNGGTQFSVSDGTNTFGPFDYGTGGTVTGLAADGNTITLTFTDAGDATCTGSADVSQNSCSNDPGCTAEAGTLSPDSNLCLSPDVSSVDLTATPNGDMVVPADFEVTYVLTSNPGLVIEQVGTSPSFTVSAVGNYIIHTLVAETSDAASPDYLDLSGVVLGTTTAVELLPAIEAVCASLDAEGASIIVSETVIDVLPCDDGTIDLVVEEGYDSYQWYKDGIMIDAADGGTSETLTISEAGEYVYTVNGADLDSECGERMCCPVIISEDPNCTECGPIKCLTGTAFKN